ncbi:TPA: hypothetical protein N0F65_004919 [Lagenidium giganteum]|uniref:ABC transporter domain-containing protein n=1 Tax=Lagenidium giganteum TaxID=4803 RepID=A0AAV2YTZ3_9STRA|nr:TPA: hypothetical protein N0F65_004919 [Lagenidium giganteum]
MSATSATVNALTSCLTDAVTFDSAYAMCVMNSGLFEVVPRSRRRNGGGSGTGTTWFSGNQLDAAMAAFGVTSNDNVGTCRLLCTSPGMTASKSCCDAASRVLECKATKLRPQCRDLLEDTFALKKQCGLSKENIGLISAASIIVFIMILLMVLAKLHARKQNSMELESRFASATATRWKALLAAWRQVTNLVWKNLIIRRRKPFKFFIEQFMPVFLVTALVFIANLDSIFGSGDNTARGDASTQASSVTAKILCTDLARLNDKEIGAPNSTMTTFYTSGQTVLGMFLLISYIKFVSSTTTTMVIEKETRIREVMKIMGLSDMTLLTSWLLTSAILSTPLAFAIAAELKYGKVFPGTEYATLVFLFWSLSLSIVGFSYFVTPFFNKSRTASIASVLLWLILFFPFFSVQPKPNSTKYWAALSPPTAFGLAVDYLLRQAQLGTGLAYSIAEAQAPIEVPTALSMSGFLVLDSIILFALGWYLEQVLPQQYGVRKPWNFIFKKDYWFPNSKEMEMETNINTPNPNASPRAGGSYLGSSVALLGEGDMVTPPVKEDAIEPVSSALVVQEANGTCLQIRGLRKTFKVEDGEKVAVHHLDLTMYSGQITALLGHNGAGKTTTISMLTGLISPTSGDATLYGRSIRHHFNELRQIMGICPQHDVLFNELTVVEHLRVFGTMKHVPPQRLEEEVSKMIQDVGLTEKRNAQAKSLSGGQKRKLSVALAFIGDSKLVFLDEPTSGMDQYSRRFTWNLLQRNREDRVIVLTTHFMDEADILGDRVAIMADGQLCCAGSSLFLKNRYGAGYNLTMNKGPQCDVEKVGHFLRQFVPEAKLLSNFGSEIVYQLPSSSSKMFAPMLQALDGQMRFLDVQQYGISVTTLEEVFLRIAKDREEGALKFVGDGGRKTSATSADSRPTVQRISPTQTFVPTFGKQYGALLKKRFRIAKRDKKSLINAICIPILFLIILASLPEINVANFLPGYTTSLVPDSQLGNCTLALANLGDPPDFSAERCNSKFEYCTLGIINCDRSVCCNNEVKQSPYFKCNMCSPSKNPPCFNTQCLDKDGAKLQVTLNAFLISMVVMLAFAFIPASIVAFIVREKNPIQNAKSLQLICGANVSAYWFSSWTHDAILTSISIIVACVVVPLSSNSLSSIMEIYGVAALIFSHALAMIPLAYLFSFRFSKHAVAQTSLLVFALTTGGLLSIFSFLCRIIDFELTNGGIKLSVLDRNYLRWVLMLFPGYGLNNGIYEIATRKLDRTSLFGANDDVNPEPATFFGLFPGLGKNPSCTHCWTANTPGCCVRGVFDLDVAGAPIIYALLEALLLTSLVFMIENRSVVWHGARDRGNRPADPEEDEDVRQERSVVERSTPMENDSIFIRNLRQQYGKGGGSKIALHDLCLRISKGECFGYLGINGAGKSTTMKILTGDIAPSSGFVTLGGYDLSVDRARARQVIGYCPQFDSLHDLLTVKEQLELYASLKGIPRSMVATAVDQKIQEVGLGEYRDKLTKGLSGGNKRKVSTAIALMGSPRIIFLDEPSTGVDPSSRRKMWDVIEAVCAEKQSSVVLTTHSMEECEALCTRVGILVSGKLRCLGSVGHLKQKYGRGFTVEAKLSDPPADRVMQLRDEVEQVIGQRADITADNLMRVCMALGVEARCRIIMSGDGNGWTMGTYLESSGHIPVDIFCSWWVSEDLSGALQAFFQDEFRGSRLVENQGDHFRFQVPKHSIRPFYIFRQLEDSKARLHVNEYSVSDTSLEHIFNNMAAQQDEERMVVAGMYDSDSDDSNNVSLGPSSVQSVRSYHRSGSNSFNRSGSFQSSFVI